MTRPGACTRAAVALGGNLGDVAATFGAALDRLSRSGVRVTDLSSLWRTRAWGREDQVDFHNAVACIETEHEPAELLDRLQREERFAGRRAGERWGPRPLDLDLLWYGRRVIRDARLEVPHALLAQRSFVLAPALEVAAGWVHPATGESLREMREQLVAAGRWTGCEIVAPANGWWSPWEAVEPAGVTCRS